MTANGSITYNASDINNKQLIASGAASYKDDNGRVVKGERVVAFLNEEGAIETINAEGNAKVIPLKALSPPPTAWITWQQQTVPTYLAM